MSNTLIYLGLAANMALSVAILRMVKKMASFDFTAFTAALTAESDATVALTTLLKSKDDQLAAAIADSRLSPEDMTRFNSLLKQFQDQNAALAAAALQNTPAAVDPNQNPADQATANSVTGTDKNQVDPNINVPVNGEIGQSPTDTDVNPTPSNPAP